MANNITVQENKSGGVVRGENGVSAVDTKGEATSVSSTPNSDVTDLGAGGADPLGDPGGGTVVTKDSRQSTSRKDGPKEREGGSWVWRSTLPRKHQVNMGDTDENEKTVNVEDNQKSLHVDIPKANDRMNGSTVVSVEGVQLQNLKSAEGGSTNVTVRSSEPKGVRFSETPEIIPDLMSGSPAPSPDIDHEDDSFQSNGFLPQGKEAHPQAYVPRAHTPHPPRKREECCSKSAICILTLVAILLVACGVIAALVVIKYLPSDESADRQVSISTQARFYRDKLVLRELPGSLFINSPSQVYRKLTDSSLSYHLVEPPSRTSWFRPLSELQLLWHAGGALKVQAIDENGNTVTYILSDPVPRSGASLWLPLSPNRWYAARLHNDSNYVLLTLVYPNTPSPPWRNATSELLRRFPELTQTIQEYI